MLLWILHYFVDIVNFAYGNKISYFSGKACASGALNIVPTWRIRL